MVLITPRLVRPLDPDEVPSLPTRPGSFLNPTEEELREDYGQPLVKPGEGMTDAPPMAPETTKRPPTPDAGKKPPKQ